MALATRISSHLWPRFRPLRNLGFASDVRNAASAPTVVLSPHLDDAVIDCWSVISAPGKIEVVNVFAGSPRAGVVTYWDRVSGAEDSSARVEERIQEDEEALAQAGRSPTNLECLGAAYRGAAREASFRDLDAKFASAIPAISALYAPAALGTMHPDHELVRAYALAMAAQGFAVALYADVPYCATHGWPAWVTGAPRDPYLDVDQTWRASFETFKDCCRGEAQVVRLDDHAAARKIAAMRTYRTQFPMLDRGPIGLLSNPLIHRFEVFWHLR
jgi:hypothetical protein